MIKGENKGFSLIELIIVIAIMAVLVAVIAPNLTKYLGSSKKQTDKKNLDEVHSQALNCISDAATRENEISIMSSEADDGTSSAVYVLRYNSATGKTTATAKTNGVDDFAKLLTANLKDSNTVSKENKSNTVISITITGSSSNGYVVSEKFADS